MMEVLQSLRNKMQENKIDVYLVPTGDPHGSEYPPDAYKYRTFLTGFTGSAGVAVVFKDEAYCWADGRYYIQAGKELEGSGFDLQKDGQPGVLSPYDYVIKMAQEGDTVGFHGELLMMKDLKKLESQRPDLSFKAVDLMTDLWEGRPSLPQEPMFILKNAYTKFTTLEKRDQIMEELKKYKADSLVLSSLDDIAWFTNLRGRDIENNPVFLSFLTLDKKHLVLYIDLRKIDQEIVEYFEQQKIVVKEYHDFYQDIKKLKGKKILLDPSKTNALVYNHLREKNQLIEAINPTTMLKAVKNKVELNNLKAAYVDDGVALVKYFSWLNQEISAGKTITEYEAQNKLINFRKNIVDYIEDSFTPISAYGANGAMMHYSAQKESSVIGKDSFYLIDSGGQYLRGTTDITRTLHFGQPTEEEKRDYTLVLKSQISLANTIFLEGTKGSQLDAIARRPIWQYHMDYKCGTGHGVGYLLNVHEGPHRISRWTEDCPLEEGYIVTIEPGIYKEDMYGIRLENDVAVKLDGTAPDGTFYSFDMLSYIPFDRKCINPELLTQEERQWLNRYNEQVYDLLAPNLNKEEEEYLSIQTEAFSEK